MYVNDLLDAAGGKPFENSCMNAQNAQAPVRRSARPATVEMMSDHG